MRAPVWKILQFIAVISLVPLAVEAAEPVVVLEAEGELTVDIFVDFSPTPFTVERWRHELADGPAYHAEMQIPDTVDRFGYIVHCDADSLCSHVSWEEPDPPAQYFAGIVIVTELTCLVQVGETIGLVADRAFMRDLGEWGTRQEVLLTGPDQTTTEILALGSDEIHAEVILAPGQYGVSIYTEYAEWNEQDVFDAHVTLRWVDALTPTRPASWAEVKVLYR